MKFIRDIIKEKKQVAETGREQSGPQQAARRAPAPDTTAAFVLDDAHAVPRRSGQDDFAEEDSHFSLFDDGNVIDGSTEPAVSLFAEQDAPEAVADIAADAAILADDPAGLDDDFDDDDAQSYSDAVLHPAPMAPAPEVDAAPDRVPPVARADAPPTPADAQPAPLEAPEDELARHILSRAGEPGPEAGEADLSAMAVPAPAAGRGSRRAGRVKTRLLGFGSAQEGVVDPIASAPRQPANSQDQFPVGWLVVVDGPGRGTAFTLFEGVSQLGRGEDQAVRLDFGDTSISRSNHAAVAYDPEQRAFFLGHGGKANLVRLNGRPVLSTEAVASGDQIRIGETSLRLVALCGSEFDWSGGSEDGQPRVSHG